MVCLILRYELQLLTPMHIGTGMGFARMIDEVIVRAGPAKGNGTRLPCIPGSAVKGKVRSRCEALAQTLEFRVCTAQVDSDRRERRCKRRLCMICSLFGSPFAPGPLCFSDAVLVKEWQEVGTRLGVSDPFALGAVRAGNKVERAVRTVEPDFLFSLEHATDELQFAGSIIGGINPRPVSGLELALPLEGWLLAVGFQAVDKIGGLRSRRLGRCRMTITSLKVDGKEFGTNLDSLLAEEDYLLGMAEYEA